MRKQFKIVKNFSYQRKENLISPRKSNEEPIYSEPLNDNGQNNKGNEVIHNPPIPTPPTVVTHKVVVVNGSKYGKQVDHYINPAAIPKKKPKVFWLFLCLFILNFGLGIAIFATQGDQTAIIVFEVVMMLLNFISGAYYYTKQIEILLDRPKCFFIFFGTMLAEFLCLFIQLIISWITQVGFAIQITNIISLTIFLLYFYNQRKKYFER
ncbi:unnamed protein product [Paramecium octaurelia]|uniref:Uncharacterized protein n=1 Tax=Paramecium octaurelia TaxID=43137 RepID=A0A8S1XZ30_PAROT|nr:unnamed protein product [Paramecium octaurelia]